MVLEYIHQISLALLVVIGIVVYMRHSGSGEHAPPRRAHGEAGSLGRKGGRIRRDQTRASRDARRAAGADRKLSEKELHTIKDLGHLMSDIRLLDGALARDLNETRNESITGFEYVSKIRADAKRVHTEFEAIKKLYERARKKQGRVFRDLKREHIDELRYLHVIRGNSHDEREAEEKAKEFVRHLERLEGTFRNKYEDAVEVLHHEYGELFAEEHDVEHKLGQLVLWLQEFENKLHQQHTLDTHTFAHSVTQARGAIGNLLSKEHVLQILRNIEGHEESVAALEREFARNERRATSETRQTTVGAQETVNPGKRRPRGRDGSNRRSRLASR